MTHTGGENATPGFREQMTWQLRAARVLTDLLERGDREGLPMLEWDTLGDNWPERALAYTSDPRLSCRLPSTISVVMRRPESLHSIAFQETKSVRLIYYFAGCNQNSCMPPLTFLSYRRQDLQVLELLHGPDKRPDECAGYCCCRPQAHRHRRLDRRPIE